MEVMTQVKLNSKRAEIRGCSNPLSRDSVSSFWLARRLNLHSLELITIGDNLPIQFIRSFRSKGARTLDDKTSKVFGALIEKGIEKLNGMVTRKGARPLVGFFKETLSTGYGLTRSRCALIVLFCRLVHKRWQSEGFRGLVLWLKVSHVLIQQAIAGDIQRDLSPLGRRVSRSRCGLPRWIPVVQRRLLMAGDIPTVRFWTSLCALYRVLAFPYTLKLESITEPGSIAIEAMDHQKDIDETIGVFWRLHDLKKWQNRWIAQKFHPFPIGKSTPTSGFVPYVDEFSPQKERNPISTSLHSILLSAILLYTKYRELGVKMLYYATGTLCYTDFRRALTHAYRAGLDLFRIQPGSDPKAFERVFDGLFLGRLSFKYEPAGKVRVFAMVECWTQWLFKPLHDLIQDLCRPIKEDATFDQIGRLEEKLKSVKSKDWRKFKAFSYDLSSATDRLPAWLQVQILRPLMGTLQSNNWIGVLTDRDYVLPRSKKALELYAKEVTSLGLPGDKVDFKTSVRYACGQPMGALSSWGMLAVTHHVIVQWAAYRAGRLPIRIRWFADYVVLGDDIVIFDAAVAAQYYYIMTQVLKVKVGLAKSISSRRDLTLEFAKKYWVKGKRAFMVPVRDIIATRLSTETMNEFMKKHDYSLLEYLKLRGVGYKARSRLTSRLWSMSARVRFYVVCNEAPRRHFLDWISMKSTTENWDVPRSSINKIAYELELERVKLMNRLWEGRPRGEKNPWIWSMDVHKVLKLMPGVSFIDQHIIDHVMPLRADFRNILEQVDRKAYQLSDFVRMTDQQIRDFLEYILQLDEELRDGAEVLSSLTWFTQVRAEDRPFDPYSTLYKKWVRFNGLITSGATSKKEEVSPSKPKRPLWRIPSNPLPPEGETDKGGWLYFFPSYPHTIKDQIFELFADKVGWVYPMLIWWQLRRFVTSFLLTTIGLIWLSSWSLDNEKVDCPIDGSSTGAYTSRSATSQDYLLDESCDDDEPGGGPKWSWWSSVVTGLQLAMLCFIIWIIFQSWNYVPVMDAPSLPVEGLSERSTFRFASFQELLDWRAAQRAPQVVRSPELGHGWSEIWTPDPDLLGSHWG